MRLTPTRTLSPTIYKGGGAVIFLYVLPVAAIGCGLICRKGRFKGIYCLLVAVLLALFAFFFRGGSFLTAEAAYNEAALLSPEELGKGTFPLGILFLAKLFSLLGLGSEVFAVTALTVLSLGFGYYIYGFCKSPLPGAAVFISLGFPFIITEDFSRAIALLLTAFGMKYMEEKRFFRYCGYMLLAACFSPTALLLIPLYFLLLPDNPLIKWALSLVTGAVLIFLPFKDELFGFLYCTGTPCETKLPLYLSVFTIISALLFTLMTKMLKQGGGYGYRFLGLMSLSAAVSVGAVLDGRLLPLFILTAASSLTVLFSEALPLILTLFLKTFPENKKNVYVVAVSVFSVSALILFTLTLFSGVLTLPVLSL